MNDPPTRGIPPESLHRFALFALENLSDATYWMQQDGSIVYVNQAACRLLGYTRDEILGQRIYDINSELSAESWGISWERLRVARKRTFETFHKTRDGRAIPVEISANMFEYEGTEYSCAFVRDISERKEVEARLRQAEKMDAVGQLAGGIAHDFNNQLAGIMGYVELLQSRIREDPGGSRMAQNILKSVERSAGLTRKLLAFARTANPISDTVEINEMVREVVAIVEHSVDKKIRINTALHARRALTVGDVSQLQNAVLNLALNARDAMTEGGTLSIETRNVELDDMAQAGATLKAPAGDYVCVSVADRGIGMDPDTARRMFEPFFTTKDPGKGTGLGLAAVYGTIKSHKGAIQVASTPGRGTRVSIYLPLMTATEAIRPPPGKESVTSLRAHVLLIDDEEQVRETVRRLLEALGCRVTVRTNGCEAVQFYEKAHSEIDVVLLDMVLPEMNGGEILAALQKINPQVKVLISSGYSFDDPRHTGVQSVSGVIQKPYTIDKLAQKLSAILTA